MLEGVAASSVEGPCASLDCQCNYGSRVLSKLQFADLRLRKPSGIRCVTRSTQLSRDDFAQKINQNIVIQCPSALRNHPIKHAEQFRRAHDYPGLFQGFSLRSRAYSFAE